MVLAHALGGGSGPEIELLILGLGFLFVGFTLRKQNTKSWVPPGVMFAGVALSAASFAFGGASGPSSAAPAGLSVHIQQPEEGSTLPAGAPSKMRIHIAGGSLTEATESDDPTQGHIHVYVDGDLRAMPTNLTPSVTLDRGEHEILVEFVGADHAQFEPRITDTVRVEAR